MQAGVQVASSLPLISAVTFPSLQLCAGVEMGKFDHCNFPFSIGLLILSSLKLHMKKGHWNWCYLTAFSEGIKAVGNVLTLSVSCRILLSPQ